MTTPLFKCGEIPVNTSCNAPAGVAITTTSASSTALSMFHSVSSTAPIFLACACAELSESYPTTLESLLPRIAIPREVPIRPSPIIV